MCFPVLLERVAHVMAAVGFLSRYLSGFYHIADAIYP